MIWPTLGYLDTSSSPYANRCGHRSRAKDSRTPAELSIKSGKSCLAWEGPALHSASMRTGHAGGSSDGFGHPPPETFGVNLASTWTGKILRSLPIADAGVRPLVPGRPRDPVAGRHSDPKPH